MSDFSNAIAAKQAQLTQLQADLDALQRAASIMGGKQKSPAKTRKRGKMSAAARQLLSQKLKAHWAKKAAAKPTPEKKRRKMSAAARKRWDNSCNPGLMVTLPPTPGPGH